MQHKSKVILGASARSSSSNDERLAKQAEAVAATLTVPPGIEFAKFAYGGRTYALSARLFIEVDLLQSRVPDVVVRQGGMQRPAPRRRKRY